MCNNQQNDHSNQDCILTICLVIGFVGILFGPFIFTRSAILECLDFSQTGDIGDTIGGITAPIVGLISILLLWLTLKEQLKFNDKQDKINSAQQALNDANKVLAIETHILRLEEKLKYTFCFRDKNKEGQGISDLKLLTHNKDTSVTIPFATLEGIIDHVHIIETTVSSLVSFLDQSILSKEEKVASYSMAESYLSLISSFYDNVTNKRIKWMVDLYDLQNENLGEENPVEVMRKKCSDYYEKMKPFIKSCHL